MKLSQIYSTKTYYIDKNFYVDIVTNFESQYYEAWLWNDRYGIKEHVISVPMEQQTYTEFLNIIENTIDEDIHYYILNYMEV